MIKKLLKFLLIIFFVGVMFYLCLLLSMHLLSEDYKIAKGVNSCFGYSYDEEKFILVELKPNAFSSDIPKNCLLSKYYEDPGYELDIFTRDGGSILLDRSSTVVKRDSKDVIEWSTPVDVEKVGSNLGSKPFQYVGELKGPAYLFLFGEYDYSGQDFPLPQMLFLDYKGRIFRRGRVEVDKISGVFINKDYAYIYSGQDIVQVNNSGTVTHEYRHYLPHIEKSPHRKEVKDMYFYENSLVVLNEMEPYIILTRFDANAEIVWQTQLEDHDITDVGGSDYRLTCRAQKILPGEEGELLLFGQSSKYYFDYRGMVYSSYNDLCSFTVDMDTGRLGSVVQYGELHDGNDGRKKLVDVIRLNTGNYMALSDVSENFHTNVHLTIVDTSGVYITSEEYGGMWDEEGIKLVPSDDGGVYIVGKKNVGYWDSSNFISYSLRIKVDQNARMSDYGYFKQKLVNLYDNIEYIKEGRWVPRFD